VVAILLRFARYAAILSIPIFMFGGQFEILSGLPEALAAGDVIDSDSYLKAMKLCNATGDKSPIDQRSHQCAIVITGAAKYGADDDVLEAFTDRCWVYILLKQFELAQADCTEALRREQAAERKFGAEWVGSRAHSVFAAWAGLRYGMKLYPEALDYENKAVDAIMTAAPGYAYIFSNRGLTFRELADYDHALADWNQAIRLDKNYMPAFLFRGIEYERRGDREKAKADFEKAVALPAEGYDFGHDKHDEAATHLKNLTAK